MTVDTVVACVQLTADKPLGERELPVEHFAERLEPRELARTFTPKSLGVSFGAAVELLVIRHALHVRLAAEFSAGSEFAALAKDGFDINGFVGSHRNYTLPRASRVFRLK